MTGIFPSRAGTFVGLLMVIATFFLSGCTTSKKVATSMPGDNHLSCRQIKAEFVKLDAVMDEATGNKGVNTANVAAVLLFWPAAVGNYMDADKAEKLVQKRRDYLMGIYTRKGC